MFTRRLTFAPLLLVTAVMAALAVGCGPVNDFSYAAIANQTIRVSEGQGEVVGGKLYSFGGFDSNKPGFTPTDRANVFDPGAGPSGTWTRLAPMPIPNAPLPNGGVTHAGMATDGTDIFYAGGYTTDAAGTGQTFGTRAAWRYNVGANTYDRLPDLPEIRAAGQLEYLDGSLHYFGGTNLRRDTDVGDHYVLNMASAPLAWTTAAPLPNPRHHMGSAVLGGKIYAIGGQYRHDSRLVTQAFTERYDPVSNRWETVAPLPRSRGHISNSTFVLGNRIVVAGGEVAHTSAVPDVTAYDAGSNSWTALTPLPDKRLSGVGGAIGTDFLYSGGSTGTMRQAGGWRARPAG